ALLLGGVMGTGLGLVLSERAGSTKDRNEPQALRMTDRGQPVTRESSRDKQEEPSRRDGPAGSTAPSDPTPVTGGKPAPPPPPPPNNDPGPPPGTTLLTLQGHTTLVNSVCFSPDGKRLASAGAYPEGGTGKGEVKIWDAERGQEVFTLRGHSNVVSS